MHPDRSIAHLEDRDAAGFSHVERVVGGLEATDFDSIGHWGSSFSRCHIIDERRLWVEKPNPGNSLPWAGYRNAKRRSLKPIACHLATITTQGTSSPASALQEVMRGS